MNPLRAAYSIRPRLMALLFLLAALLPVGRESAASAASTPYNTLTVMRISAPASTGHSTLAADIAAMQTSTSTLPLPGSTAVSQGASRYFPQTVHFLRGAFLNFWQTHGATPVLGLPITEPILEDGLTVQYLERARLEYHPEISTDPNRAVLLTRLGASLVERRGLFFAQAIPTENTTNSFYFSETGHNLANAFLSYWQRNGGLPVFGYPLSDEIVETNQADGKQYSVQYFERNRFEWHPENSPAFNVQLGLLGTEYAVSTSLDPMARILLPAPVDASEDLADSPKLAALVSSDLLPAVQALAHTPQFRWVPAVLIQNNIPVGFSDIDEQGVAGALVSTRSRTRPYAIVIPQSERDESPLALASVIAHEATHAFDITTGILSPKSSCSIEEETRAYMNGLASWIVLQGENALGQQYPENSLDAAINRSVRGFNGGKIVLSLNFSPRDAKGFLRTLYGNSCGQ